MSAAKVVSLSVRPLHASHLCFDVGGILGECNAELGAPVKAFDFAGFYATLGPMPTAPGDPARLVYDFLEVQSFVKPFTLAALRSEPNKAALSKAINARANAYYSKYGNAKNIIASMNQYFSPDAKNPPGALVSLSKPQLLDALNATNDLQWTELKEAYEDTHDPRTGVVKATSSVLTSTLTSSGSSKTVGQSGQIGNDFPHAGAAEIDQAPGGGQLFIGGGTVHEVAGNSSDTATSAGSATENQTILNTDYGYRVPYLEAKAQYARAQISLIDQRFAQFMAGQSLPHLAEVFQNELSSIDSDVYQRQIAYLNTILMSPIDGTVTGVYKNPGDPVRPGEPVIRVENNADLLLVATLIYRGPISIGSDVTVETTLFDVPGPQTKVNGKVVAVRGHQAADQWEVIVNCNNHDSSGKPIFPLGYHFDYDNTKISVT
jgi:HlyD family secretion protein